MNVYYLLAIVVIAFPAFAVETGDPVPECPAELSDRSGKLNLEAFRGKVVLIDFWATWCPPCRKSMPFLNTLHEQRRSDGFEVVAINVDEKADDARRYLESFPVDYTIVYDSSGECPRIFDVAVMPSSYLIDRKGVVRLVHRGFRDDDKAAIAQRVDQLLTE